MSTTAPAGRLFVVATPIGNLEDITLRALRVLSEVAVVAAEDTRKAQILFERHGITTPRTSYFTGNEAARAEELVRRMIAGESVAVISEAGMPGISDPGERLIARAIAAGIAVEVIPGPSAALTALVGSGLPGERFLFVGFLPRAEGERSEQLGKLRGEPATLIFYESPHRAGHLLAELALCFGPERRACLARELTKIHEEYVRATLGELAERFSAEEPRGEVVLVVAGAPDEPAPAPADIESEVAQRLASGQTPREIAAALSLAHGLPRRKIYQLALVLAGKRGQ